jgi:hypothetical protein
MGLSGLPLNSDAWTRWTVLSIASTFGVATEFAGAEAGDERLWTGGLLVIGLGIGTVLVRRPPGTENGAGSSHRPGRTLKRPPTRGRLAT